MLMKVIPACDWCEFVLDYLLNVTQKQKPALSPKGVRISARITSILFTRHTVCVRVCVCGKGGANSCVAHTQKSNYKAVKME